MTTSVEQRLAALERSRRRERGIGAGIITMLLVALFAWSPAAQGQKPLDQRVDDLEKRVLVLTGGSGPGQAAPRLVTPFEIRDATGRVVMRVDDAAGHASLELGSPTSGGISMGQDRDGAGFVQVRTGFGRPGTELGGNDMGVRVFGQDGKEVQAALELNDVEEGQLKVGVDGKGGVVLGVGDSGSGFMMTRRDNGNLAINLGRLEGGPMGVTVLNESGKRAATMVADTAGGRVNVMNPGGTPVGGIQAAAVGGRIALTGAGGGNSMVSLGAAATGGIVSVFSQSGGPGRVSMVADGAASSITVYDPTGLGAGWIETGAAGAGRFVLQNKGETMVEAGTLTPDGVGMVKTGPAGRAGGGMGIPGSFIMGKQQ